MPHNPLSSGIVEARNLLPLEFWNKIRDHLPLNVGLQTQQSRGGLVEIDDSSRFVDYQNSVLDGVKQRLKKISLARQPLNDCLKPLCIQPPYAAKHFI